MSKYDGSVRIDSKVHTKDAEVQLMALENRIKKTSDKIASLRSKMDALKDVKIPTDEYTEIQRQIEVTKNKIADLVARQEKFLNTGGRQSSSAFQKMQYDLEELRNSLPYLEDELQDLVDTGKDFTLGQNTEEYAKLGQQIHYLENDLSVATQKHGILSNKIKRNAEGYRELANRAKSSLESISKHMKKANEFVNGFGRRIKDVAQKYLPIFRKETQKSQNSISGFGKRLKSLALSLLIFNRISAAFRAVSSSVKAGFENLYNDNEKFKTSIDGLRASVLTLQNTFAAAFRPIADMAVPYVQKLVEWLTEAVNLAGQFFAALAGRKTYTRAIKQTAAASEDAAEAAEDETEAMNKQLSPLDKLNNLTSENNRKKDKGKDDKESGIGTMFEEVPIDSGILDMVDKVKKVLSKLFAPLKEAWNREGKFVMDSWKYALNEVWKLIRDIGRDFLTVWQQEKTIKIFQDLLHIIGDIGLIIGNLAARFREAWNENDVGLHILEKIRDIIGIIVEHVRNMADATVEWAANLDFYPLLDAFDRLLESLKPVVDNLMGILEDFYTKVLLPLGTWVLEKGLPELLQVFIDFNDRVDWETLRANLAEFWEHLEPFAETVGEGLIIFIDRVSDALADFLNSQEFKDFLVMIENWMDSVSPEDVADALVLIAEALIGLKLAILGFGAISAVVGIFTALTTFLSSIGTLGGMVISGAKLIAGGIGSILTAIGSIPAILAMVAAAVAGWKIGEWINTNLLGVDTPSFNEMMEGIKSSFTDGSWKEALKLWGEDIKWAWSEIWGYVKEDFNNSILGTILGSFTDGTWRDALKLWGDDIYNAFVTLGERQEEWLNSLQEKWSKTWSGIKEKISGAIGSIKSTVGSAIDWIKSKLDSLKSSFNIGTGVAGGKLFGGRSTSYSTASPYAANSALMAAASAPIPALATGTVIPPNREFLAVLGDQKHGTNIEAPLSTIENAVINAMAKVNNAMGGSNGGGTVTVEIPVVINGIGEIGRAMQQFDMEFFKQNGRHAFSG